MAADLAARGFHVNLYNRTAERIRETALRGEIELEREDGTFTQVVRESGFLLCLTATRSLSQPI